MTSPLTLTVIIVTFNSQTVLPACLAALSDALEGVGRYELIVSDNASTDASVRIAAAHPLRPRVLRLERNSGYAAGINAALRVALPSQAILVLNPDVRLDRDAVRRLYARLSHGDVGIAVPRMVDGEGKLFHSLRRQPTVRRALGEAVVGGRRAGRWASWGEVIVADEAYGQAGTADWATGAVMLFSRACLEAVGAWDERFFLYSEETDFSLRARDRGFLLAYVPDAVAVHLGGGSGVVPELYSMLTVNRIRLFRKRHGPVRSAVFSLAVVVNELLRAPLGGPTHRAALRALVRRRSASGERRTGDVAAPRHDHSSQPKPDYVCFSIQDWWYYSHGHSDFQLMRRVAQERRVLFVNSIGMRMPLPGRSTMFVRRILRKARSVAKFLRRPVPELPGLFVMTPVILPFYASPRMRAVNTWLVARQVRLAARLARINDPICFVTVPTAWPAATRIPHRGIIYNRSDKHSAYGETEQDYIQDLERDLLAHADRVLYVSRRLMEEERDATGERAYFLDHGVDLDHFAAHTSTAEPPDLAAIARPRIGYFGGLDDYLVDFSLLERLAKELPHAQLVLIGDATEPMEALQSLPNVHWLGYRPYADIPSYGRGFDVAIMPWQDNEWIRFCNPIKLKEYLALGLPVVSTDFPEVRHYQQWVRIAVDSADFVVQVAETLDDRQWGSPHERRQAVASSSWDDRAAALMAVCDDVARASSRTSMGAGAAVQ